MTDEFSETDHWKPLATAKRFLTGADVLRRSAEYQASRILLAPVLHLTAHGIEVLLKANLVGAGLTLDEVRKKYGHDITALWAHDLNRLLRDEAHPKPGKSGRPLRPMDDGRIALTTIRRNCWKNISLPSVRSTRPHPNMPCDMSRHPR